MKFQIEDEEHKDEQHKDEEHKDEKHEDEEHEDEDDGSTVPKQHAKNAPSASSADAASILPTSPGRATARSMDTSYSFASRSTRSLLK